MLKKLFAYDMKNLSKLLVGTCVTLIGSGALACLLFYVSMLLPDKFTFIPMLPYAILMLCILTGGPLMTLYIFIYYYRSFYTDTGYLTFVFPATMKEHLNAKLLSGILFSLAIALSTVIGALIALIPNLGASWLLLLFNGVSSTTNVLMILLYAVLILTSLISQVFLVYLAITLGSLFFSKHKVLGSVIFYFVVNWGVSLVEGILSVIVIALIASLPEIASMIASVLLSLVCAVGVLIASYIINLRMLERRLNL